MDLALFLKREAQIQGFKEGNFEENITFKINKEKPKNTAGVVYGFVAELNNEEKEELFNEAKRLGGNKPKEVFNVKPIADNYYPLYWGKSLDSFGRITAHLNAHNGNNNLRLKQYITLNNKEIIYARIYLENNEVFEEYLSKKYPQMLKTRKK